MTSINDKIMRRENTWNRRPHRALVLQGGVALGAYESGVIKTLFEKLMDEDKKKGDVGKPLFDVVAGTSAGAINAAIIVSYVKENKKWEGVAQTLEDFWRYLSVPTPWTAAFYEQWLGEAARRYYSSKHAFYQGVEKVFSGPNFTIDNRFHDYFPYFDGIPNINPNTWISYDNTPLKNSLEQEYKPGKQFVKFPIATTLEDEEPRLLTISVDIQEGTAVTFDSYNKNKGDVKTPERKTVYGNDLKEPIILSYDYGLRLEHVMASATFPIYFKYQDIGGRKFCDGGILSNTPLRELLQAHRDYWHKIRNEPVPDLDVYLINVWPGKETSVQTDYDGVKDRKNDIIFGDKTTYDQKVALMVGDYLDLFDKTRQLAIEHIKDQNEKKAFEKAIDLLKAKNTKSRHRNGDLRTYAELIDGRFKLKKIVTIERVDDHNSISDKWADFTNETIEQMIHDGENYQQTAIVKKL